MAQLNFGGVVEEVITREEFPLDKAREVLKTKPSPYLAMVCKVRVRLATYATTALT